MKLDKPTPILKKTLTKKLFESKNEWSEKNLIIDEKELPSLTSDKKIEIDSILGKSHSDF